jgi:hypothetical protein
MGDKIGRDDVPKACDAVEKLRFPLASAKVWSRAKSDSEMRMPMLFVRSCERSCILPTSNAASLRQ